MNSEFTIAVHALVFLNHKRESVSSDKLAANICTNPARVRKIMGKLKKKGLISTKEGVVGGYLFDLDPSKVTLYDVSSALDVPFVSSSWRSGGSDLPCLVASGMAGIMDDIYGTLDQLCKDYLKQVTIQTIDQQIFGSSTVKENENEKI